MKLRNGLLLGAAFVAGVAVRPCVSGLMGAPLRPAFLGPGRVRPGSTGDNAETYRLLSLFGDVFERVRAEYVEPVADRDLIENAINGMLTGLDPHSNYMNAKAVPRHAGADPRRVRRPWHRGHAGKRLHQGDHPDRRHPGIARRGQGRAT